MELQYHRGVVTGTIQLDVGDTLGDVLNEHVLNDVNDYADEGILESAKITRIEVVPYRSNLFHNHVILHFRGDSDET